MLLTEFEEKLKSLDDQYEVFVSPAKSQAFIKYKKYDYYHIASIDMKESYVFDVKTGHLNNIDKSKREELTDLIYQFAKTEAKKRYEEAL